MRNELIELEESTNMPYIMSFERMAEERGEKRGEAKALLRLMRAKFGPPTPDIEARLQAADAEQLERWLDRILTANTHDELFG